ncbi:hypothetical protein I6B53_02190 [Schaalia sp. 19OD2882]|uniref:hypothetical protein n=1 Tax=Schaalia sp. 19OD2882 TaxID=2794089 RepID=UPI001C1EA9AE|nr:hypothetical protein [Schaalia sp. 19OD2882]QWW19944.1 hypothetical protein I6B53_02190 [Schaalia sp. 19OD2882]
MGTEDEEASVGGVGDRVVESLVSPPSVEVKCLNQRKKKRCSAKTVRKDEIELRVEEITASFVAEPELLASLAVDLADHYHADPRAR